MDTLRVRQEHQCKRYIAQLTVYRFREGEAYIYYCPSLDLTAYGYTIEDGLHAFDTTARLYFEDVITRGLLVRDLRRLGWDIKSAKQNKTKSPSDVELSERIPQFADMLRGNYERIERSLSVAA